MAKAIESGASPWAWATQREQHMVLLMWSALAPATARDAGVAGAGAVEDTPREDAARDGGEHDEGEEEVRDTSDDTVYASRVLSLLQAATTGSANVSIRMLDEAGRAVAQASGLPMGQGQPDWAPTGADGAISGQVAQPPGGGAGAGAGDGGGAGGAGGGRGVDLDFGSSSNGGGGGGGSGGGAADATGAVGDPEDEDEVEVDLNSFSELVARHKAKLGQMIAESEEGIGGGAGAGAGAGASTGAEFAPQRAVGDGGVGAQGSAPASGSNAAELDDLPDSHPRRREAMGIGVQWDPTLLRALGPLLAHRSLVTAPMQSRDGMHLLNTVSMPCLALTPVLVHADVSTVGSVAGGTVVTSASSVAAARAHQGSGPAPVGVDYTFAPVLCDHSRELAANREAQARQIARELELANGDPYRGSGASVQSAAADRVVAKVGPPGC